jgi:hypothetical protein
MEEHVHAAICLGNSSTPFCTSQQFERQRMSHLEGLEEAVNWVEEQRKDDGGGGVLDSN